LGFLPRFFGYKKVSGSEKTHTKNILGKLNVKNRRQAVVRARQLGLLSPE